MARRKTHCRLKMSQAFLIMTLKTCTCQPCSSALEVHDEVQRAVVHLTSYVSNTHVILKAMIKSTVSRYRGISLNTEPCGYRLAVQYNTIMPNETSLHLHPALSSSFYLVQSSCSRDLCACSLSSYWQTHGVSSASVCSHVFQPPYILLHFSPQVVFDLHVCELFRQTKDRRVLQCANFRPWVDVIFSHDTLRDFGTNSKETFEGPLRDVRLLQMVISARKCLP